MYHQKSTIGIIEDDTELRETLGHLLSYYGYKAELFASATEFLRVADVEKFPCLLVDISLDTISGLELGRRLAEAGCTVPIIFMTGIGDPDLHEAARKLGCVALLQKPFFPNELLDALANAAKLRS